jgi:hypothetical protein
MYFFPFPHVFLFLSLISIGHLCPASFPTLSGIDMWAWESRFCYRLFLLEVMIPWVAGWENMGYMKQ